MGEHRLNNNMYFVTHMRIVSALLIREMSTRFGNKPGGYIWALLDPVAHVLMLTIIFQGIAHLPPLGTSFTLFFATGYVGFYFYQGTTNYLDDALKANKALLSYPNVAPIDTLVARLFLQLGTMAMVAVIVLGTIISTLHLPLTIDWAAILSAVLAAALLAFGVSLANTVLFLRSPLYEKLYQIAMKPSFMLSGVFFLPDALPHPFQDIITLNPVIHIVALFRKGFYAEYRATALDLNYLMGFIFICLMGGLTLFTLSTRTLRNE
ncbi:MULTISPECIES: ABC transporter permease [Alphaproteobacteria]|uniref:Transport permease protein n=2 Tax=Alphaproteobacteria TaxID=28211 RepID=A0A512HJR2_9HYPH|nr:MULTISPECIES: ABC transporter permease [Alphaproteobacteria]GEO85693.1 transport permease protein [Ciceribacter naphthalenivorans]GLR21948.1 transport permease protein [Ciceribacter naphthalenivorans]GLT04804.1 transport permease protein [Sphingomonas psychrolutea]